MFPRSIPSIFNAILIASAAALVGCSQPSAQEVAQRSDTDILQVAGATMGTRYEVKIADPPADLPDDWQLRIERELRRVNDQMSTYLAGSEISRFNASQSTDWFEVSPETAMVVAAGQQVALLTDGAFDMTVGPLVDLWSFGPEKRDRQLPDEALIRARIAAMGYRSLHVRSDRPALRKDKPQLRVDLSALAKGHGVDRIVDLLTSLQCDNVFVNIGGEIRATGDKGSAGPWRAGVERPDEVVTALLFPVTIADEAIATSGDYRNYFEIDGKRYSHTIDPRTGYPVSHSLAAVSVVAENCMLADAWATALNVLGPEEGVKIAEAQSLDAFLLQRIEHAGESDNQVVKRFQPHAVGRFVEWSKGVSLQN